MTQGGAEDRSISVGRDAVNSTIVSGDGNTVTIYYQTAPADVGPKTALGPNPYVGLLAFTEAEADRFFGREVLVGRLWSRFRDIVDDKGSCRFLAILGPSGCGKSSVARAGLLAEFARRPPSDVSRLRIAVMTPGERPLEALAAVMARMLTRDPAPVAKTREFESELRLKTEGRGHDGLRRIAGALSDIRREPLIVYVDQFEEIYSLCRCDEDRKIFIETLMDAASDSAGFTSVIITLRSDFLGATQADNGLNQWIARQNVVVPTMSPDELRKAISEPAARAGHPLGEDAVKRMLDDAEGRDGVLPLLQFVLVRIWEGMAKQQSPSATLDDLGGVGGALGAEAERLFLKLAPAEQAIARRAFLRLVTFGEAGRPTRRRVPLDHLITARDGVDRGDALTALSAVLETFARQGSRLITLSGDADGGRTAEVTHEALFDRWPALKEWLADRREDIRFHQRLEEAAQIWVATGRSDGALWRGPNLERLIAFEVGNSQDLTADERAFMQASIDDAAREAALRREATILLPSKLLAASARRATEDGNAVLGLLLGLEALPAGDPDRREFAEATFALQDAIANLRCKGIVDERWAKDAVFSPDGRRIATTAFDKHVRLKGLYAADDDLQFPELHTDIVWQASFSSDGGRLVTASEDKTARIWNAVTGAPIGAPLNGHSEGVTCAAFSPDGRWIITGSKDHSVRIWDVETGEQTGPPLLGHTERVTSVSFSADGSRAISGSWDATARIWDAVARTAYGAALSGHTRMLNSAAFSPDGQWVVTASGDGTARTWAVETQSPSLVLRGHADDVTCAQFSPDGRRIVTASSDRTLRLWDAETGAPRGRPLAGHTKDIQSVAFRRDGRLIVSAASDGAWVWDSTDQPEPRQTLYHEDLIGGAGFSPDGRRAMTAVAGGGLIVWDLATEQKVVTLREDHLTSATFSPDGLSILTVTRDYGAHVGAIHIWNIDTGERVFELVDESFGDRAIFSTDGRRILTTEYSAAILWDLASASRVREFRGHKGWIAGAAFSADGRRLVTASDDQTARVWDVATGAELRKLGHKDKVGFAAFSPDGRRVVTASDEVALFWDPVTGAQAGKPLVGHRSKVKTARYSASGAQVLTVAEDQTARFWDVATGAPIGGPLEGAEGIITAAYSPDGRTVITTGSGCVAQLWDAPPDLTGEALRAEALRRKPRDLTDEERRLYGLGRARGRQR